MISARLRVSVPLWFRSAPSTLTVALFVSWLAAGCAGRAEQAFLRGYFDTCAAADDVSLANIALVALDPKRDGVVGTFRVLKVDPETEQPAAAHPRAVRLSLLDPLRPHDEGAAVLLTKTVQLLAEVHRDGRVSEEPLAVTLSRAKTPETIGRWIVVRLVRGGRTLPEASSGRR